MELWDLYDKNRTPLGKTMVRGQPVPAGCFFTAVSIWVVNNKGEILLTLRAPEKKSWANYWENSGGAVQAGETSLQAAARELREETGICAQPEELRFIGTDRWPEGFMDVFLCSKTVPIEQITLQPTETADAKWVSLEQFHEMCRQGLVAQPIIERFEHFSADLLDFINTCKQS